jgi:hypothetical protein
LPTAVIAAGTQGATPGHESREEADMTRPDFEQHSHEATVHDHEHWHVTHNWSETAGTFQHLASKHSHEHDHAGLSHAHVPHADLDSEHAGEAHVHDHDRPVDVDHTG